MDTSQCLLFKNIRPLCEMIHQEFYKNIKNDSEISNPKRKVTTPAHYYLTRQI